MSLDAGTRLGPYEIQAAIGAGGMGEVYRARDTRLDRTVAIKILLPAVASDHDRRLRFEREAKTIAALNHSHICTLYDVGDRDGALFLVMEHLAGETLAARLRKGPLPLAQALTISTQIADALAAAHGQGIVHRDLKPGNVMLVGAAGRNSPHAKLLDFGLAKLKAREVVGTTGGLSMLPTQDPATGVGTILGTLPYMAPEQLEGHDADARSDIFSLGAVLYEMLTGRRAFPGDSQASVISAVMSAEPPALSTLQPVTPAALDHLVQRCLEKDPGRRWQNAADVAAELRWIATGSGSAAGVAQSTVRPAARRRRWPWMAAAAVLMAAGGWVAFGILSGRGTDDWEKFAAGRRLTRLLSTSEEETSAATLSRDGRMLCSIIAAADGSTDVYVARVAGGARIRLTSDPALEASPRFSPDGELVAFARSSDAALSSSEVRIVPSLGGQVVALIPDAASPAWAPDGRRLAYVRRNPAAGDLLIAASVDGSAPSVILPSDGRYPSLRNPAWSPDGKQVAVVRGTGGAAGEIWLVPSQAGTARRLFDEPAAAWSDFPVFTPDGRGIIHSSNRGGTTNVWVAPLDGSAPVRLTTGPGADESLSVAADGTIAFLNSRWWNLLQAFDYETGVSRTLLKESHGQYLWAPSVSPDGREVAFSRAETDGSWHVWAVPFAGGTARRLTFSDQGEVYPRWFRDGRSMLFYTWNQPRRFGRVARDGSGIQWVSFGGDKGDGRDLLADPSPDGRRVAFARGEGKTEHVYIADLGGGPARLLTASPGSVPRWSPDGTRIAFSGNRFLIGGIYTIREDGTGERQLTDDGAWPVWWPDGKTIGYQARDDRGNQQLRVVPSEGGPVRPLSAVRLRGTNHPFCIAPDGRTIVVSNSQHMDDEIWLLKADGSRRASDR